MIISICSHSRSILFSSHRNHVYKPTKQATVDTISVYNNDNRTFIQAEKSDIKTHYCGFMADS